MPHVRHSQAYEQFPEEFNCTNASGKTCRKPNVTLRMIVLNRNAYKMQTLVTCMYNTLD